MIRFTVSHSQAENELWSWRVHDYSSTDPGKVEIQTFKTILVDQSQQSISRTTSKVYFQQNLFHLHFHFLHEMLTIFFSVIFLCHPVSKNHQLHLIISDLTGSCKYLFQVRSNGWPLLL